MLLEHEKALKSGIVNCTFSKMQTMTKPEINLHVFGTITHGGSPIAWRNSKKGKTKEWPINTPYKELSNQGEGYMLHQF